MVALTHLQISSIDFKSESKPQGNTRLIYQMTGSIHVVILTVFVEVYF